MAKKLYPFEGYSRDVTEFFIKLADNNSKEWFDENRKFYEKNIRDVNKSLVNDMSERFANLGLPFIADTKKSLFRINRDIRFSNNKDPYKTNIGAFFPFGFEPQDGKAPEKVGLYFHFEPNGCFIAGGLHMPSSTKLKEIRTKLLDNYEELEEIINREHFRNEFNNILEDESLKRMPQGFAKNHPAEKYLKLKSYTILSNIDIEDTYSTKILDIIERKAVASSEFLNYFII